MNYNQRRSSILSAFSQAKLDLENLNKEIKANISHNKTRIKQLKEENKGLSSLNLKNKISIKIFSKFLS
ncbi:hypothetical protein D0T53_12610 [Dysgonomonas sp. 216]|nr:hypothetical protein [Dysgonomonas sp. 216]